MGYIHKQYFKWGIDTFFYVFQKQHGSLFTVQVNNTPYFHFFFHFRLHLIFRFSPEHPDMLTTLGLLYMQVREFTIELLHIDERNVSCLFVRFPDYIL